MHPIEYNKIQIIKYNSWWVSALKCSGTWGGIPVPKYLGADTPYEMYFIILFYCILWSAFVGWCECRKMHDMSNNKQSNVRFA